MAIFLCLGESAVDEARPAEVRGREIAAVLEDRRIPIDTKTLRALVSLACALAFELGIQRLARSPAALGRTAAGRLWHSTRWPG
jgi:hypothetical protein